VRPVALFQIANQIGDRIGLGELAPDRRAGETGLAFVPLRSRCVIGDLRAMEIPPIERIN
jgi:hypothetical protein